MYLLLAASLLAFSISDDGSDIFHKDPIEASKFYPVENFSKTENATTLLRGKKIPFCFWYNDNVWVIDKWHENLDEKILMHSLDYKMDATIIAEMAPTPKKMIRSLVWENAEWDFDNVTFLFEETRMVNDAQVKAFQWTANFAGKNEKIPKGKLFAFYAYVYTTQHITVQILTSCPFEDFEFLEPKMTDFLNGLTSCEY